MPVSLATAAAAYCATFTVVDYFSASILAVQILLAVLGVSFFISGVDDLFFDLCFIVWKFYRRLFKFRYSSLPQADILLRAPQKPIAILIPAWDEANVIRPMLSNMLRTIDYGRFQIFVGTYPNDRSTQHEVDLITDEFPNVHQIVCRNSGPTCKADCLNNVYQGILDYEKANDIRFEIFAMDDCEDLVHPYALRLFNYLVPAYDMVQLPVFPFARGGKDLVGDHYIDEFTEYHGKDIFVRWLLSGALPAAGVGCAFSRRAVAALASCQDGDLFNTSSLTEDYELGLRIGALGFRCTFVSHSCVPLEGYRGAWRPHDRVDARIAIREYFPSTIRAAVKQKSRWVTGIALQGWSNLGWKGGAGLRYTLFRDRKALVTNELCLAGYGMALLVLCVLGYSHFAPDAYHYPALVRKGSWLWYVLLANFGFLLNRMGWRFYSVYSVYGWHQALLAVPRQACSNIINGFATTRAIYLFCRAVLKGKSIAWDKTAHVLPASVTSHGGSARTLASETR